MKILMLLRDYLVPTRPDVAVLFGKRLCAQGIQSTLLGQLRRGQLPESVVWAGGSIFWLGRERPGMLGDLLRPVYDGLLISRHWAAHDLVQVRDKIRTGAFVLLLSKMLGRPFAYWMSFPIVEGLASRAKQVGRSHGLLVWVANALRARISKVIFYRWILPYADHVFVQSEAMADFVAAKGIPRTKLTAVPMGVDTSMLAVSRPSTQHPKMSGRLVLGYLGSISLSRQSDFLLDVVARVRQRVPEAFLLIAGDAVSEDERQWFRRRIGELGLADHVWLTGWLPQAEALQLFRQATVALSPIPRGELFDVSSPTKAVEYLALGLPCVGNDIPDQALVIQQSGAGLCVPMEVPAFADAVLALLASPEMAARMGALGPDWVQQNRSYDVIADRVGTVYRQLLAQQGSVR